MGLGEIRTTRRAFTLGGVGAAVGAALVAEACGQKPSPRQPRAVETTPSPFSLDTSIVYSGNLVEATESVWEKARENKFRSFVFSSSDVPILDEGSQGIQLLVSSVELEKQGIQAIRFGRDALSKKLILRLDLIDNVKIGRQFREQTLPTGIRIPEAAIFMKNNTRYGSAATVGFRAVANSALVEPSHLGFDSPIKRLDLLFDVDEKDIDGYEFIYHLQPGLLNADGEDRKAFTVPFRLKVENNRLPSNGRRII